MSLPHNSRKSMEKAYLRWGIEDAERAAVIKNPDSAYWIYKARETRDLLEREIGSDDYEELAELVWPGDSIDAPLTWKVIYEQTEVLYFEAMSGTTDLHTLADAVKYPRQPVPECYGL